MKTKKFLCLLLSTIMLISALSLFVSAKEFTTDGNLLLHWDFEGDTQEEQLANKAPRGAAGDKLTFTTDGTSSAIANGEATIGAATSEWLSFTVDEANGIGTTLLDDITDEYTVYVRYKATNALAGAPLVLGVNEKKLNSAAGIRVLRSGGTTYARLHFNGGYQISANYGKLAENTYSVLAITMTRVSKGSCTMTMYETHDDWNTSGTNTVTGNASAAMFVDGSDLNFSGKQWSQSSQGQYFTYDDIRVYGKALSEDELKAIGSEQISAEPVFEGVQLRNVSDETFDIRFVARIHSLDYAEAGFRMNLESLTGTLDEKTGVKTTGDIELQSRVVYRYLGYTDESGNQKTYDAGEDSYYVAISLKGIPLTSGTDFLSGTITAYAVDVDGNEYVSDTYILTVTDGKTCEILPASGN